MANNTVLAKLAVIISANAAEFNRAMAESNKRMNSFEKGFRNLALSVGVGFGLNELVSQFRSFIGVISNFESTMSTVRAITGATASEFSKLEKDAKRLGATTKFTATQVGELQVNYGRLGFTTKEILNATEATLALAAATGEDLAKSADVAGSTVRGFELSAKDTIKVVDVMASSFNKTALGLDNFTESMKYVAPVAKATGATVEETTALLGVLADAGIRGSMAGTSLRKIFTDMTKDGRPLIERLAELGKKGITLSDSFDEVGRTAQTSLLILTKNTDKIQNLTTAFQNAEGEAIKMSRIITDNLEGDVKRLESAWEGLLLKVGDTNPWRNAVRGLTDFLSVLQGGGVSTETLLIDLADDIKNGLKNFDKSPIVSKLKEIRKELGKPFDIRIADELAEKFNLTAFEAKRLKDALQLINSELSFNEAVIKKVKDLQQAKGYETEAQAVNELQKIVRANAAAKELEFRAVTKGMSAEEARQPLMKKAIDLYQKQKDEFNRTLKVLSEYEDSLIAAAKGIDILGKSSQSYYDKFGTSSFIFDLGIDYASLKHYMESQARTLQDAGAEVFSRLSFNFPAPEIEFDEFGNALVEGFQKEIADFAVKAETIVMDLGSSIGSALGDIAYSLGEAFAGGEDFGKSFLKILSNFCAQVGSAAIALGITMLNLRAAFATPGAAIAAGVALLAVAGALGAASKAQDNFNRGSARSAGSGSSRSATGSLFDQLGERIYLQGEFEVSGTSLKTVISNQNRVDGRTRT